MRLFLALYRFTVSHNMYYVKLLDLKMRLKIFFDTFLAFFVSNTICIFHGCRLYYGKP